MDLDAPTQMLVTTLAYDDYKGRIAIGRLFRGRLSKSQDIVRIDTDGGNQRAASPTSLRTRVWIASR